MRSRLDAAALPGGKGKAAFEEETPLKFFDFNDPFFRPLWIRIATVTLPALWGLVELYNGETFWGVLFLVLTALSFHGLFIAFNPREREKEKE